MNYGTIKNVGNGQVDVQLTGSARVLRNVQISAQVSWNTLALGTKVLVDTVNDRPVVLHTLTDVPHLYTEEQTYAVPGAYGPENALLADGSVPLTGDLAVTPGVKIDGYDISVLGQTIDNLQAADSVARTGYTVMTHASHLVETISEDDTQLKIRHDLFADKETLAVSNTAGEVEFMRVVGQAVPTVDDRGAICYLYTVTRRTSTSPVGLITGWAAATLVNGLTHRGYIAFDARENRPAAPSMRFVLHTDIDAGTTEHIVRVGSLKNILDYTSEDYGFAVGRLTIADKYLAYSYADNRFRIRGADIATADESGVEVFRIWGTAEGGHVPGDFRFGPASGGHQEWFSENQRLSFFSGSREVLYFSPDGTRFREMLWSGTQPGPQIGIGEDGGEGHIVARSATGVEQFHVRTGADSVHIHMGNPPLEGGYAQFTQGEFLVDGTVRARAFELLGGGTITPGGTLIAQDPDSDAYGELAPKYLAGFNEAGTQTALIAWGNVTAAGKTWVPGEGFLGPVDASHFRKRGDEMGFFFGDTPKAWLDKNGNASFDGSITATSGSIAGWTISSGHLYAGAGSSRAGLQPASYPFYAGSETPGSAPFRVTPTGALTASSATISGTVYAQGGHFAGSVYVGTADPRIKLDGVNKLIESTNFASGTSGFRLSGETGDAEFNNVTVRGAINASIFNYQQVTATAGTLVVTIGAGKALHAVYTDNENGFLVDIEDPDGIAHATAGGLWTVNDIVRLKDPGIADIWAKVTAKADMTTYWRLTVMQQSGGVLGYTFPAGAAVVNYGQSGKGLVRITADDASAPFLSIATHTGTPWTSQTERVRLGNLSGLSGASGYGLWTDNGYLTGTIIANAGAIGGWTIASGHLYTGSGSTRVGLQPASYPFYAGSETPSSAPFRVTPAGALTASNAAITGAITANAGAIGGWTIASGHLYAGSGSTRVGLQPADYPFYAGSDTPSSAPFRVTNAGALTATSATITGTVYAQAGTFSGSVYVGTADPRIKLDGANKLIESTNFASGVAGFRLSGHTGDAEFNNVTVRGALGVTVLQYGVVQATSGSIWVTKAAGKAQSNVTPSGGTATIDIEDPDGIAHAAAGGLWNANDVVRLKEPLLGDWWGVITSKTDMTTYWRLSVTQQSGSGATFPAGVAVLNYGQSGDGVVRITADATNSPYVSIGTHAGSPWSSITEKARLGNLSGVSGASGYGLWTNNGYFTGTIIANAGAIAGWTIDAGHLYAGSGATRTGLQPASYPFYAGSEAPGSAPFRVTPAGALTASSATITGTVYAQAGHFAGSVYVGTADPRIKLDGVNKLIESTNFASGVSGFRMSGETGDAEFNNVTVRGAINAAIFNYQQVTATAGTLVVTIGAGKALQNIVTNNQNSFVIDIEDPDGIAHATAGSLWAVNDIVRLKDPAIADIWAKVTAKSDMTTYWRLTVSQQSGGVLSYTFPAGAAVVNYGQSGKGMARITADDANAPFLSIATHTGTPWTSQTERVRLGNLTGISGASGYGLWTDNGFFTGTINASAGSIAGWTIASTKLYWEDAVNYRGIGMATYNDADGWAFWAGDHRPSYAEFRVSTNGALWATSADITGAITANSGSIGGWTIASGHLYAGSGSSRAGLQPASYPFYAGSDTPSSAPFRVTPAGALTASSATITGTITSTAGTIGGWTIASTSLRAGSGSTTVGLDSGGTNPAIYAGSATPGSAPFRVTSAGVLTATSGAIGGWTLGSAALTSGSGATTVGLDSSGTNPTIYAGSATPGSAPFRVTNAGALTATNVSITAGGGSVVVDTNGLTMTYGNTAARKIQWKDSGTVRGAIGCWYGLANYAIFLDAPEIDLNGTLVAGKITMTGDLEHSSLGKVGFFGATPATRPSAYTFTNGTIDRSVNCDSSSVAELADLVYTMWSDLKSLGLLQ